MTRRKRPEGTDTKEPRQSKATAYFLCRATEGERLLGIWIIMKDGAAHSGLLHGNVDRQTADFIKSQTSLEWVEETRGALPFATGRDEGPKPCKQPGLFDAVPDDLTDDEWGQMYQDDLEDQKKAKHEMEDRSDERP